MPFYSHNLTRRGLLVDLSEHLFYHPEHFLYIPKFILDLCKDEGFGWDTPLPAEVVIQINLWMVDLQIEVFPGPFTQ